MSTKRNALHHSAKLHSRLSELLHRFGDVGDDNVQNEKLRKDILEAELAIVAGRIEIAEWLIDPGTVDPPEEPPGEPPVEDITSPFWVDPDSEASRRVAQLLTSNPERAALLNQLARRVVSVWYNGGDLAKVRFALAQAKAQNKALTIVLYNVPGRDSGNHSAGGEADLAAYECSVNALANLIRDEWQGAEQRVFVVIEPDALNLPDSLDDDRRKALRSACREIGQLTDEGLNVVGYLDIGHSNWRSPDEIAERVRSVSPHKQTGLVSNVSSFQPTESEHAYCAAVADATGGRRWIIDTARNGLGERQSEWCNPGNVIAGQWPTLTTGRDNCDALIWIKPPGESDGECNGGPRAGLFFEDWAVSFVERSQLRGTL